MNKYFIGFEIPEDLKYKLTLAQDYVRESFAETTRVLPKDEFHITSLFIGKCPRQAAEDICNSLAWGLGSMYFRFDGVTAFYAGGKPNALVLKLQDLYGNAEMMHRVLRESATVHPDIKMDSKRWPYNPHITLAKCEGTPDAAIQSASDAINDKMAHNVQRTDFFCDHLVLFEKVDGAKAYEPHRMMKLR